MNTNTRNLLIGCMVSVFVGIIMGVGLVAPSIETVEVSSTPETMELCINDVISITNALDECHETRMRTVEVARTFREAAFTKGVTEEALTVCESDRDGWEERFNICMTINDDLSTEVSKAHTLVGKCIEGFSNAMGVENNE